MVASATYQLLWTFDFQKEWADFFVFDVPHVVQGSNIFATFPPRHDKKARRRHDEKIEEKDV